MFNRTKSVILVLCVTGLLVPSAGQPAQAQGNLSDEYIRITGERVNKAIASGAKKDIRLAEGSLCGLGWLALYGNGDESFALAKKLAQTVAKAYNGTQKMPIYREHTSEYYAEMLNLKRFKTGKAVTVSPAYIQLTRERVNKALAQGAGQKEFRLAEGGLCALGWLVLHGNDNKSLARAKTLMDLAARAWPAKDGIYMVQSSEAYTEMINLGRLKHLAQQPKAGDVITNKSGIKLAWVPPGGGFNGFHMGIYTVTQKQWQAIMGNNPSRFKSDDLPVEQVTWNQCVDFCEKLSKSEGKTYRLPTEAEWEYACRAGSKTKYYFGDNLNALGNYAWFSENSDKKTHPVGQKKPNAWGLYDMHGNVWQWTSSREDGSFRVIRGGSWNSFAGVCAASFRSWYEPGDSFDNVGFRLLAVP